MNRKHTTPLLLAVVAALALAACGKKEETPAPVVAPARAPTPAPVVTTPPPAPAGVSFSSVTLGNQLNANQTVNMTAKAFTPKDTIYAAVATNGAAPNAALVARWTFADGQLVDETSQSIAPTGPAVTTFQIAKPDGFPVGSYKVAITLDGKPVASESFQVQ